MNPLLGCLAEDPHETSSLIFLIVKIIKVSSAAILLCALRVNRSFKDKNDFSWIILFFKLKYVN